MATVKEHYDQHLGFFYSWMSGDFFAAVDLQVKLFNKLNVKPIGNQQAIDLGAGNGIQTCALQKLSFKVKAIDFNETLLGELKANCMAENLEIFHDDLLNVGKYGEPAPELICCCGDTIAHLRDEGQIGDFLRSCHEVLGDRGSLVLSFRDYSNGLQGTQRFIPVKCDENRILTCVLDYEENFVKVTDLLHKKVEGKWVMKVSEYRKVRVTVEKVESLLRKNGFEIAEKDTGRMNTLVAIKQG